jgi:hypothetical protein
MRKLVVIIFLAISLVGRGQMYDAQWVLSFNSSSLDFRIDTIGLSVIPGNIPMFEANANICDSNGNLLYYTNGFFVAGNDGNSLLNGDTLSPCVYTSQNYSGGSGIGQSVIFFPRPGNSRYYGLFHFSNDTLNRPCTVYHSSIDIEGNSGLGSLIEKNVPVLTNVILREGGMTACKHANGRDYWIVIPGHHNNEFYEFLLAPDTILGPFLQSIGPIFNSQYDYGYSKFSQDGSKYVTSCAEGLILVMDFDRCSGQFSNPETLFHNASTIPNQPVSGAVSVEFSTSGQFLYATNSADLTQYNLSSSDVQDSDEIYVSDSNDFFGLDMLQLGPNGKMYCSTYNGGLYALHVINYPDSLGSSCGFVYGGQHTLTNNSVNVPNMINYNLGPLIGSGCDTIKTGIANAGENNLLRIRPNPADKYLYVEVGMQGSYEFDLLNAAGQILDKKETRQVDIFDTEHLASGVYFLRVIDKATGAEVCGRKVVVVH